MSSSTWILIVKGRYRGRIKRIFGEHIRKQINRDSRKLLKKRKA